MCKYCDAEFNGHGNQRYCSKECYTNAGRIRNKEKYWSDGKKRKNLSWPSDVTKREREVWHSYGLYLEEYEAMLAQGCAICGEEATDLDHDHETGRVREALCRGCNVRISRTNEEAIRKLEDKIEFIRRDLFYLEKHR